MVATYYVSLNGVVDIDFQLGNELQIFFADGFAKLEIPDATSRLQSLHKNFAALLETLNTEIQISSRQLEPRIVRIDEESLTILDYIRNTDKKINLPNGKNKPTSDQGISEVLQNVSSGFSNTIPFMKSLFHTIQYLDAGFPFKSLNSSFIDQMFNFIIELTNFFKVKLDVIILNNEQLKRKRLENEKIKETLKSEIIKTRKFRI